MSCSRAAKSCVAGNRWGTAECLSQQHRNNSDVEFIDQIRPEELAGEFATAHEPDVFAAAFAETANEGGRGLVDEREPISFARRLGVGEDVGRQSWRY